MRAVMLILLAATLAGCVGENTEFDPVEAPTWQAGHAYSYTMSGDAAASATVKLNGEVIDEDSESEPIPPTPYLSYEVLTNQATIDGAKYYLLAAAVEGAMSPFGGAGFPTALAVRQSDLTPFPIQLEPLSVVGSQEWAYLDFPLTPGKTWSYEMPNGAGGDDLVGDFAMRAEATKSRLINTPLGDMEAIQVVTRAGFPDMAAMVQEVQKEFEDEGFTDVKIDVNPKMTVVAEYAPAIKNVAKETTHIDIHLRLQFKDGSDAYDLITDASVTLIADITGASLSAANDLGQAGAVQALIAGRLPVDVEGVATVPIDDVSLAIEASATEVNAGQANSVTFTITATGVPDGMFVDYELVDAMGQAIVAGQGTNFDHSFTAPGVHYARAAVTNGNGYSVAVASIPIVADYKATVTADCAQVSTRIGFACDPVVVPLRPGQFTARIDAAAVTAGQTGVPGTFAYEQFGVSTSQETLDGTASLNLNQFPGAATNGRVSWQAAAAGALEDVTFAIDLDYSMPTPDSPVSNTLDWQSVLAQMLDELGLLTPL